MLQTVPLKLVVAGATRVISDLTTNTVAGNHEGLLGDADVGLFTAWPGYQQDLEIADLTIATYTGYAIQAVVWGTSYVDDLGKPSRRSGLHTFTPNDAVTPNTILGVYLLNAAGALQAIGQLPTPVVLDSALASLAVILDLAMDPTLVFGAALADN